MIRRPPRSTQSRSSAASDVYKRQGEADLIAVLRRAQAEYGHLPEPVVREIARLTGIVESRVFSAITFYAFLAERRQGKFIVRLCRTISCDLQGKDRVARRLENELGIGFGETTGCLLYTSPSPRD